MMSLENPNRNKYEQNFNVFLSGTIEHNIKRSRFIVEEL